SAAPEAEVEEEDVAAGPGVVSRYQRVVPSTSISRRWSVTAGTPPRLRQPGEGTGAIEASVVVVLAVVGAAVDAPDTDGRGVASSSLLHATAPTTASTATAAMATNAADRAGRPERRGRARSFGGGVVIGSGTPGTVL